MDRTNIHAQAPTSRPPCSSISISEEGVRSLLRGLDPNKAPGPDGVTPRILKELDDELAPSFALLYQSSLNSGSVPQDWRSANVTPIFKKGERYRPENYRPISLTSVPCKVLEHIVVHTVMEYAETHGIIKEEQHGFRKRRSCESQLLGLVDELSECLASGKQTDILVMDFAKAFDKVCHALLLHKLSHFGITGSVNNWIRGFLNDRKQAVVVEGATSGLIPVESGVPQGSVLGPCLFLLYINDLPENLTSTTRMFADDTACHRDITSPIDQQSLQSDLDLMAEWERKWLMSFHPEKCLTLHVTRKQNPLLGSYTLHGQTLKSVHEAKYLGVTITDDLRWNSHVTTTVDKANRALGFLRRNLKIGSKSIKERAYKALVRPILEYSSTVWDPHTEENSTKVEAVQRRAARWVTSRHRQTSSVGEMLEILQRSSLQSRRRKMRLLAFYKFHTGDMVINSKAKPTRKKKPTYNIRNSHSCAYKVKTRTQDYREKSFFPRTISEWNRLPATAVLAASAEAFRTQI